jgi:type I restriction enzyme S subunit
MVPCPGVVIGRKGKLGSAYYLDMPFWPHDTSLWVKDFHGNAPKFGVLCLRWLRLDRFDAATSVPTLNRNFVHPLSISIPPVEEQDRIVARVEAFDGRLDSEKVQLSKLHAFKVGLMEDLFTGRVRVKPEEAE